MMENIDKGLTVPKWVLIVRPKMPQNLSAQFVCPSPKLLDLIGKRLHWASVVRGPSPPEIPIDRHNDLDIKENEIKEMKLRK